MPRPPVCRATLLLAAVATIALGACGSAIAPEDRSLSKREYIQRSNELQRTHRAAFSQLPAAARTPATARSQITALDALSSGLEKLRPPRQWRDEHATMLESLATMRQALVIISRASATNRRAIAAQVDRHLEAQRAFEQAVEDVNTSR